MELSLRNYQILKIKKDLKDKNFFVFFNGARLNSNSWLFNEQNLNKLDLNYQKIYNKLSLKSFDRSIYKNLKRFINGEIFIIKPRNQSKPIVFNNLTKLKPIFIPFVIKINGKFYTIGQFKNLKFINYKIKIVELIKTIKLHKRLVIIQ